MPKGSHMFYSPTLLFFVACGFLSAWLSFSIAYLMLKSWNTVREDFLLGFPVGFSLLALSYIMLDISYIFPLTDAWNWLRLLLSPWGFAFLAVTYFLRYGSTGTGKWDSARLPLSILTVLTISTVALIFLLPTALLPSIDTSELGFRIVNLVILGYVIYNLNKALKTETELSTVVLGFTFLTIDQYSLLLNTLDRTFVWSVIFAQLVRIAGLFILTIFLVRGFQRRAGR
jgi:hypothetical protein